MALGIINERGQVVKMWLFVGRNLNFGDDIILYDKITTKTLKDTNIMPPCAYPIRFVLLKGQAHNI